ncbi:MAG: hotdog fold thioesterase, partial [Saprospiraceae bacterium]|nr:hotdog fold thioesterase [Saprospiraceae bacterium]
MSTIADEDKAQWIVDNMYQNDAFSQWLGIERLVVQPGSCVLRMTVREEMLNGFRISHGGIAYSFADSALAFASNSRGNHAVSVETSISHTAPLHAGDVITATATEEHLGHKIAIYRVEVVNQHNHRIAIFKGTVYRTS